MPAPTQLESFTAGVATAVDVPGIERQLTALWQMAADRDSGAVTRASLFNLVAYTESTAARDAATDVIRDLTSRHPCRAIVLLGRPSEPQTELTAAITAHCHLAGGGGKQVCCEQISITAAGAGYTQLPGAVLPLLEADLPTVVWWRENFLEQPELFARLASVADRIIFDTSHWSDVPLARLADLVAGARRCRFSDLSWTRLAFWQRLTAEMFDPPECRAELARLEAVTIRHGAGPGARLRALLYGGWLAARLGWPAVDARRRVELHSARDIDARVGGLLRITFRSAAGEFVIWKEADQQVAGTIAQLPRVCQLPRRRALWPTDEVALLSQELDQPARAALYEQTLRLAAELAGRPGRA